MVEESMSDFTELVDLAAERLGGAVLWATDDFFAEKENLLKPTEAVFIDGKYTDRGKWMDGWESRRKRSYAESTLAHPEHDYAIIRLGLPGIVRGFVVDTAHFKGNYPKACTIEGASIPHGHPHVNELTSDKVKWTPILALTDLRGDSKNFFTVESAQRFTHLRFWIHPDGGVARLRVHGVAVPHARWLGKKERPQLVDLAAAEHGGLVVACNDMFFGSRHNLIMPGRGVNMGDGWETKRSRRTGPDWVVVKLATEGLIERVIVDTLHFKGNAPDACALEVNRGDAGADGAKDEGWRPLLAKTNLQPHTEHVFEDELASDAGPATHVRMRIWPDGGVSRLRLFAIPTDEGRERAGMRYVRAMPEPELRTALKACCGCEAWVDAMVKERPFADLATMKKRAGAIWTAFGQKEFDEAFSAHPRIGDRQAKGTEGKEQARVAEASQATLDELRDANRTYEEKFGRIYIVCATGKSAEEMLAIARERMKNDPETELRRAADEQRKITELRLEKLVQR
jgi:allantoicase